MSSRILERPLFLRLSEKLRKKLENPEYRHAYVAEHVRTWVARQIRALREQRGWSQTKFAEEARKPQSTISRLENPDYGQMTVQTLLELAATFDVALDIKFIDFPTFLSRSRDVGSDTMEVASFANSFEDAIFSGAQVTRANDWQFADAFLLRHSGTSSAKSDATTQAGENWPVGLPTLVGQGLATAETGFAALNVSNSIN